MHPGESILSSRPPNTLYETKCLKDIVEFIEDLMSARKIQKEAADRMSIVEMIINTPITLGNKGTSLK